MKNSQNMFADVDENGVREGTVNIGFHWGNE